MCLSNGMTLAYCTKAVNSPQKIQQVFKSVTKKLGGFGFRVFL